MSPIDTTHPQSPTKSSSTSPTPTQTQTQTQTSTSTSTSTSTQAQAQAQAQIETEPSVEPASSHASIFPTESITPSTLATQTAQNDQITPSREQPKRRFKTFKGCHTCRSRKIKCDLGKPHCQKCIKAKLTCAGYDIRLRWSKPIEFRPIYNGEGDGTGANCPANSSNISVNSCDVKSTKVIFRTIDEMRDEDLRREGTPTAPEQLHYRRLIDFVVWKEPYKTYDDMDRDLAYLQTHTGNTQDVNPQDATKMKGPFGVFRGIKHEKRRQQRNQRQQYKKPKVAKPSKSVTTNPSQRQAQHQQKRSPHKNNQIHTKENIQQFSPSSAIESPQSMTMANDASQISMDAVPQDQFWLSNELKDAALISAAALDTHYLDLMNNYDLNNNMPIANDANFDGFGFNLNNPDLLNLVFHNKAQLFNSIPPQSQPQSQPQPQPQSQSQSQTSLQTPSSVANMSMSNILNHQHHPQNATPQQSQQHYNSDALIDPIHYSNFSNFFYNNPYQMNDNLEIQLHAQSTGADDSEVVEGDRSNDSTLLATIMKTVQNPLRVNFDLGLPKQQFGIPSTALQVQPLTRYLLNYYVTDVADLMTVIPLTENPWKAIYFPRALMAIGELSALGKTTTAKNALLNALLAVSAFNLQSKFPKNSEPMKFYLNLGIALRNQASLFVKQLLNSNQKNNNNIQAGIEHCVSHEKYKDVLCAVMTMISVDLVWGTMQDTGLYITWCGKVIVAKMANKKKLSSKARILHRIFSSLKLIQDSTSLQFESVRDDFDSNAGFGYDVNGDKFGKTAQINNSNNKNNNNGNSGNSSGSGGGDNSYQRKIPTNKGRIDFIVNNSFSSPRPTTTTTSPQFVNKKLINTKKNDENFATDALYGLPNSLILLFSETVELLRVKIYYTGIRKSPPSDYGPRVQDLDKNLQDWRLDWELFAGQNLNGGSFAGEGYNSAKVVGSGLNSPTSTSTHTVQREKGVGDGDGGDGNKKFFSSMHEATYHHIMSFYHALVIYFNRFVLGVASFKLQNRVESTLYHLNSIQELIAQGKANIIPLFWQGFIAGCEAKSSELQVGFKKWGADIAQYLGSYWGARQIMLEVWRRRRMKESKDDWVSVVQDWEMNLMLN
ncbi:arginine metabolism regulation protein II [Lodderomyces elongisporus]|uniref:arginine metabolism regulation protein II n=1 Tax=Lodderomyces elongisporus TaxID=36914 RepID=UPI002922BC8D|nr:arginine metabolism regulation protein II [Lodderomyces elongisporus]WLF79323.1 arginine metabolism regulation protein II [Lodderomyces elongisporus]